MVGKIAESEKGSPVHYHAGAWEPLARGLVAFHKGDSGATLRVFTDQGQPEAMPLSVFFRGRGDLREVDRLAITLARGRVLDGGAGVGSLTLLLQEDGLRVTAAEVIPEAVQIMRERGVRDPRLSQLDALPPTASFDTILLLMNGTALAGTARGFPRLLGSLRGLLRPGGQVLLDSTDLRLRAGTEAQGANEATSGRAALGPVELQYQLEFRGRKGEPFPQLFLDPGSLIELCRAEGWVAEVELEADGGEYLARLTDSQRPSNA